MTLRAHLAGLTCVTALTVVMAQAQHSHSLSPYAGQEGREIVSLSPADIDELERGGGWAMARPAELNGVPGPAHLLDLADDIGLTPAQVSALTAIRERMRTDAIAAGAAFIAAERALNDAFVNAVPSPGTLEQLVADAGRARAALRLVHLAAHLETPALLSPSQVARYNILRGYAEDPCTTIPKGHDPEMWRRHNGCD